MIPDDRHPLASLLADLTAERYTRTPPKPGQATAAAREAERNRLLLALELLDADDGEAAPGTSSKTVLRVVGEDI